MKLIHIVMVADIYYPAGKKYRYFDNKNDAIKCEKYFMDLYNIPDENYDLDGVPTHTNESCYEVSYYTEPLNPNYS